MIPDCLLHIVWDYYCRKSYGLKFSIRDVVTFLSVEGPNKGTLGQTWRGPTICINPYPAQNVGAWAHQAP